MLRKPQPINEEQQQEEEIDEYELNEYGEDVFEFKFRENFYEDLDLMDSMNEENSKEEEDDDDDTDSDDDWDDYDDYDADDDWEDDDDDDNDDWDDEDDDADEDVDSGTSCVCLTGNRVLNEEVKYKLDFGNLDVLESQLVVTDESTACDTSDEEQWGKDKMETWKNWDYQAWNSPECYFP
ncbi:hypothetical protein STEG23_030372 [Scotinomys teguina]